MNEPTGRDLVPLQPAIVSITEMQQEIIAQCRDVTNDPERVLRDYTMLARRKLVFTVPNNLRKG